MAEWFASLRCNGGKSSMDKGDSEMNKTVRFSIGVLLASAIALAGTASFAQDTKSRMRERKPVIDDLKVQGIVGENNGGFLEFLSGIREKEDVIAAENSDREGVYRTIAKREGTTPARVGSLRAAQIAKKGRPGQWFQDAQGKWYKK